MIKVQVINEINNKQFGATFPTQEAAQVWINKCIDNNYWGLPEREISIEGITDQMKQRVMTVREVIDEDDGESHFICKVRADYKISIINEMEDDEWRAELQRARRANDYPSQLEIIEALMENFSGRPEKLTELIERRETVRRKYPKPGQHFLD